MYEKPRRRSRDIGAGAQVDRYKGPGNARPFEDLQRNTVLMVEKTLFAAGNLSSVVLTLDDTRVFPLIGKQTQAFSLKGQVVREL